MTRHRSHGSEVLDFIRAALRLLFLMNVALLAVAFFFLDESDPVESADGIRQAAVFLAFGVVLAVIALFSGRSGRATDGPKREVVELMATIGACVVFFLGTVWSMYILAAV